MWGKDRLDVLKEQLSQQYGISCVPYTLDVRDATQVEALFQKLEKDKIFIEKETK